MKLPKLEMYIKQGSSQKEGLHHANIYTHEWYDTWNSDMTIIKRINELEILKFKTINVQCIIQIHSWQFWFAQEVDQVRKCVLFF